jgi:hypothetical protein
MVSILIIVHMIPLYIYYHSSPQVVEDTMNTNTRSSERTRRGALTVMVEPVTFQDVVSIFLYCIVISIPPSAPNEHHRSSVQSHC